MSKLTFLNDLEIRFLNLAIMHLSIIMLMSFAFIRTQPPNLVALWMTTAHIQKFLQKQRFNSLWHYHNTNIKPVS